MRLTFCFLCLIGGSALALADDLGKSHKYKKADLPRSITAKTGDVIVIIEQVKPADIKSIKAGSDKPEVKARAVEMDGEVRIVITGDKGAEAKVSWSYEKKSGGDGGYKDLQIKIE